MTGKPLELNSRIKQKPALTGVQRLTPPMFFFTRDRNINGFSGLIVEHLYVKFGYRFWDIERKTDRRVNTPIDPKNCNILFYGGFMLGWV